MRARRFWGCVLAATLLSVTSATAQWTRTQALDAMVQPDPAARLAGVERLADIGLMVDAAAVLDRLADADPRVRIAAESSIWKIWSRSGDPQIDQLFAQGVQQMRGAALEDALTIFNEIVRRKPELPRAGTSAPPSTSCLARTTSHCRTVTRCSNATPAISVHCRAQVKSTFSWATRDAHSSTSAVLSRSIRIWRGRCK